MQVIENAPLGKVGDSLQIAVPRGPERDVAIAAIPLRRGPAPEAAKSYIETAESIERRRKAAEERAARGSYLPPTAGKPDKRTRRLLLRARQRGINEQ